MSAHELWTYGELSARGVRYSPRHLARLEAAGEFPQHIRRRDRRSGWRRAEIMAWLTARGITGDAPDQAA